MKLLIFALCVVSAFGGLSAQKPVWQPSPGHTQVPIWPGRVPDPQPVAGPEFAETTAKPWMDTGRPATGVSNVTRPTMTVYPPKGNNTGTAVVVFPGGGYQGLAIDLEGTEVCDWLTPRGITCVLLKYRVTNVGPYPKSGPYPESPMALEDAQRTVGLVRFHAAEWHIDPHKIGVLGFSSGGHLVAAISNHFDHRLYPAVGCCGRFQQIRTQASDRNVENMPASAEVASRLQSHFPCWAIHAKGLRMNRKADRRADATRCVHSGEERHGQAAPLTTPIAQTAVFVIPSVKALRRYAEGDRDLYLYTRYGNPTVAAAEEKIAELESAEAAVATSSGMAAELVAALITCQAGDEIVSILDVYGGTLKLFEQVLPRCGIKTRFIPYHDIANAHRYFSRKTRMLFLETPTNPTVRCVDLAALAEVGRKHKACVVADNTFATPVLQKPLELGADIVTHSATKYLGGHSDLTAGVLAGSKKWMEAARQTMILTGGCLDPGCAYLLLRGLKTLHVRVERACRNAAQIAEALEAHPKVARVYYPGLESHEAHQLARRQMKDFGMMVSFDIRGGERAAARFIDRLQLWYLAASLGGVESTVSYPALSSHIGLSAKQLDLLGVSRSTIRLSVGIEDAGDLISDLSQALTRA